MRSSSDYVNYHDDFLVCGFNASTCSGDSVDETFYNEGVIITVDSTVWFNNNKQFGMGGSLKFLTVTCHRILIFKN